MAKISDNTQFTGEEVFNILVRTEFSDNEEY